MYCVVIVVMRSLQCLHKGMSSTFLCAEFCVFPLCKYLGNTFPLYPKHSTLHRSTQHCSIIAINCTSLNKEFYGFSCMEMATKKCLVTLAHLFLAMQMHFIGQLSRYWPICTTFYNKKWINVSRTNCKTVIQKKLILQQRQNIPQTHTILSINPILLFYYFNKEYVVGSASTEMNC